MASANRLWGAERIRGELLKLGVRVSKRSIQRYMRTARPRGPRGQRWATFLRNDAHEIWACDFLQAYGVFFRPVFALAFIELATRKVVLAATTRFPSQAWMKDSAFGRIGEVANTGRLGVGLRCLGSEIAIYEANVRVHDGRTTRSGNARSTADPRQRDQRAGNQRPDTSCILLVEVDGASRSVRLNIVRDV